MTEHKSNLKALEPVEIRLAAAVRVRHEIARLQEVETALDASAREIAVSVVGGEFADVILKVVGKPFDDGPDLFDQSAVETFLAENHDLRLGTAALVASPSSGTPAAGAAETGRQPAAAAQPDASALPPAEGEAPSAAAAVAARLSAYDVELPEDYCGVSFDMIKRPEANLIMGEAVLAVIDGSSLDASPYKADRGKVHWRRKLCEETFLRFEANPPRPRAAEEPEQTREGEPTAVVSEETSPTAVARPDLAPTPEPEPTPEPDAPAGLPASEPAPVSVPAVAAIQAPAAAPAASAHIQHPTPPSVRVEAEPPSDPAPTVAATVLGQSGSAPSSAPAGDGRAGMAAIDPLHQAPASGQIIEFPGAPSAPQSTVDADDVLDPFESTPTLRPAAIDAVRDVRAAETGSVDADEAEETRADGEDAAGEDDATPTYDGPDWEGPSEEEADLDRSFDDRIHYDPRAEGEVEAGAVVRPAALDHAAAAALAEAAAPPVLEERDAQRLPVGGVPPRPPIPMPTARPAPAAPPRPSAAMPVGPGTSAPPPRPALSGTGETGRLAPRPVAVRPPGL
jgi:hypothetical protein